jgi:porphobilinogen synthase
MSFPATRMRRLRATGTLRNLVRETHLMPSQLVLPLFVDATADEPRPVTSMPGVDRLPVAAAAEQAAVAAGLGLGGVLLFGVPQTKDDAGSEAYEEHGVIQRAIQAIKAAAPELLVVTDVCLCEFTSHGHCGLLAPDGSIENDSSVETLAKIAVSHAAAGADIVAPSDMMDGRVGALRARLDADGFAMTPILAYSAKFSSAFYGPFRDAADCAPAFGDRRTYQMDPANSREALREVALDEAEGADMIMVKPALPYLDVIRAVRDAFDVPVAAYNVSGEYAMVKAAAQAGWLEERQAALESLTAIKRAGADLVVSYWTKDLAQWL